MAEQDHVQQYSRYNSGQPFADPAIMSASFPQPAPSDARFAQAVSAMSYSQPHMSFGPPPGISFPPPGLSPSPSLANMGNGMDMASNGEYNSFVFKGRESHIRVPSTERRAFSVRKFYTRF